MIWLIGNKGMLGSEIARELEESGTAFIGTDREVDITDEGAVLAFAQEHRPAWIVNCAAYTAVDKAEDEPELAERLNATGPLNIARAAATVNARLVHISTDYVYDGSADTPYTEDQPVHPDSVYGATKAHGEANVLAPLPHSAWIIRTAWLYGFDGKNFVYTMTRATNENATRIVVNDQRGTPTCALTLANAIITLIRKVDAGSTVEPGIYHCTDLGNITWYDFACKIYELGKKYGHIQNDCAINPCDSSAFPQKAHRPPYSVLSKDKLQAALGITLPQWEESLDRFMQDARFKVR